MRFAVSIWDALFGKKVTFDLAGPEGTTIRRTVTKKWLERMEEHGKISRVEKPVVEVHMLDPIAGYYVAPWIVGEDVGEESVAKFKDPESGHLYAVTHYEQGQPRVMLVARALWEAAKTAGNY